MIGPFVSPIILICILEIKKIFFFLRFPGEEVLDWLNVEFWKCQHIIKDRKVARAITARVLVLINLENLLAHLKQLPNEFIIPVVVVMTIQNYYSRQNLSRKKI